MSTGTEIRLPNATVVARREVGPDLEIWVVRHDTEPVPDFEPGQFLQLGLPLERPADGAATRVRTVKRAYSIASSPAEKQGFELFLARVSEGRLTPTLWRVEVGGRCWLDPEPRGRFTLEGVPRDADLVLVATGTGIAPYVSMLRTYGLGGARAEARPWRRCAVIHGVRRAADLGYGDELRAHAAADPDLCYLPIASREPEASGWAGLRGHVQAVLEGERCRELAGMALDPLRCHVYLCGNPGMIDSVRQSLVARGFLTGPGNQPGNLHFERYW